MLGARRDPLKSGEAARGMLLGMAAGELLGGDAALPLTWHALTLAESLREAGRLIPDRVVAAWLELPSLHRLPTGSTTGIALRMAARGMESEELGPAAASAAGPSALDLPLVRVLPVALAASRSGAATRTWAQLAAGITHGELLAQLAAVATALLARDLLTMDLEDSLVRMAQAVREETPEAFQRRLRPPERGAGVPEGTDAPDVLEAAVAALAGARTWADAVDAASSRNTPGDQLPALVGGLAGARWGLRAVDQEVLAQLPGDLPSRLLAAAELLGTGPVESPLAPSGWTWPDPR